MSGPSRPRSLFWAFAGVFLAVLAVATALQVVVGVTVIRPLERSNESGEAEVALTAIASRIAALPDAADEAAVGAILQPHPEGRRRRFGFVFVMAASGRLVTDPPLPRAVRGLPASGEAAPRGGQPGEPADNRPQFEILARRTVARGNDVLGELYALRPGDRGGLSGAEKRALLLFVPFAVLAAGGAGLIMVRLLVRRLRALESSLARVARGDLAARVEDRPLDEIGRLEARFNRMTESLERARTEAAAADDQRRRLLSDIAHELATPLTSIRGYVETLLDPAVPKTEAECERYLRDVVEESERLDLLIRDLLDLVRLEAGASRLTSERLDWVALVRNTTRRWELRLREAGLDLKWAGDPGEAWVRADGRRLVQALESLLGNALRYVPAGGVVTVALDRRETEGGGRFELAVGDDGPGLSPADLPHVFERFWRGAGARSTSGMGLGLAIVREIMRAHGGSARVEPNAPRGVRFVLELPGEAPKPA